MKRSIIPVLRSFVLLSFFSLSSLCFADLLEDQLNLLKSQKDKAHIEVNRKYSDLLAALLEKVKANKDEAMAIKIRQEMFDVGFPHKDDWILGKWVVSDSDNCRRTYTFAATGAAAYTHFEGAIGISDSNLVGVLTKEQDGSYRVTFGKILMFVSQGPRGGIVVTRWHDIKDYPNKSKAITGTAKR
jgi:hypothetical protein